MQLNDYIPCIPTAIMAIIGVVITLKPPQSKYWKGIIIFCITLLAIATVVINGSLDRRSKQELDHKFNDMITLYNSDRDFEDKKKVLTQYYKEYYDTNEAVAEKGVEELIKSQQQRIDELNALTEKEKVFKGELELKWVPFIEIVLEEFFDKHINAFIKSGVHIKLERVENPDFIILYNTASSGTLLRRAIFPNGTYIEIESTPAIIREGKLLVILVIRFNDTNTSGAILMLFRDKSVGFEEVGMSGYYTEKAPLDDRIFATKAKESIAKLINRVYLDDVQKGKQ